MKTKEKKAKPPKERKPKKKRRFEDGVRIALVATAVLCAAVLGIGGFFAVRSMFSNTGELSAADAVQDSSISIPPAEIPIIPATSDTSSGTEILPELDDAIRDLGATAEIPSTPQSGTHKGILALVIDDAGNNLQSLDPFLKFPGPITIAVLPELANSVESARRIRAAGKELFLHQPMEPLNGQDPGPGAIKTGMTPTQVKEILVHNFTQIGPVAGFNNHEGSRATMDMAIMLPLMEVSRDSALVFLDSRTIADTAAPEAARQVGVTIAQRDIFLDNEQDRASILAALEEGCRRAEQNGTAILIGHVWTPRLADLLIEMYPQLIQRGFTFTTVSSTINRNK